MTETSHVRLKQYALGLLPVLLAIPHMWRYWPSTSVDTATYVSYARTIAIGHGFALQPDAVQSYGVASPLWVLIQLPLELLNMDPINLAKIVGALLGAIFLWLLPGIGRRLSGRDHLTFLDLLPALLLAASPLFVEAVVSGDETSLYLLMLALTLGAFLQEERRFLAGVPSPGALGSLLPALLLLACRPEAPLLIAALFCWRVLARATGGRLPRASLAWLLLAPLGFGLYIAGTYALFAEPWSGVITSREALVETRPGTALALRLAWVELSDAWATWGGTIPLLAVALLGAMRSVNYWGRTTLLALCAANLAGILLLTGADEGRLALPALACSLLLAREGLGSLARRLWPVPASWLTRVGMAAIVLGLAAPVIMSSARQLTTFRVPALAREMPLLEAVSRTVRSLGWENREVSVLTSSPGSAAFFDFRVHDASGLTDPAIRRYSGNRRPLELQQLIFQGRQPDVIIERGLWKVVHNLSRYPEASRLYIPLRDLHIRGVRVSVARRLVLEHEPWPDQSMRMALGQGLELLGIRVEPGHLVLLFTTNRKINGNPMLKVQLGQGWVGEVPIGPSFYPVNAWRPGELVRTRIPLPLELANNEALLRLGLDVPIPVATVDLGALSQDPVAWRSRVASRYTHVGDWDTAEAVAFISRRPLVGNKKMTARVLARVKGLQAKGLLQPAIRQLQVVGSIYSGDQALAILASELAAQAYKQALSDIQGSRWTSAFALLRAAARANPSSAWIARRLEEARRRMPAGSHLIEEIELEMARRALVLVPTVGNLARVMGAHMALGQYQMVIATAHTWKQRIAPSRRTQFLLAKALVKVGRLANARDLVQILLTDPPKKRQPRSCNTGVWPKLLLLHAELLQQLGSDELANEPTGQFAGRGKLVGNNSLLFAHCVRWAPDRPVEVDLYIWQREPEALRMSLNVGSRLVHLDLAESKQSIRLVRKSFWLPPASYPVRLQGEGKAPVALGTVKVGPEITFGFELPGFPGWQKAGTAFGRSAMVGRSFTKRKLFGYAGERFADSYYKLADFARGRIVSPPFLIRRSHLMLLVAGGDSKKLGVDLMVDGKRLYTVRGRRSETMRLVMLYVGRHRGKWARVKVIDRDQSKWGHLAVDEIRQLDGPIPGVAP